MDNEDKISLVEKNKQRISIIQILTVIMLTIGAGTIGMINQVYKNPNSFNISLSIIGCCVSAALVFIFIYLLVKTKKIVL